MCAAAHSDSKNIDSEFIVANDGNDVCLALMTKTVRRLQWGLSNNHIIEQKYPATLLGKYYQFHLPEL